MVDGLLGTAVDSGSALVVVREAPDEDAAVVDDAPAAETLRGVHTFCSNGGRLGNCNLHSFVLCEDFILTHRNLRNDDELPLFCADRKRVRAEPIFVNHDSRQQAHRRAIERFVDWTQKVVEEEVALEVTEPLALPGLVREQERAELSLWCLLLYFFTHAKPLCR